MPKRFAQNSWNCKIINSKESLLKLPLTSPHLPGPLLQPPLSLWAESKTPTDVNMKLRPRQTDKPLKREFPSALLVTDGVRSELSCRDVNAPPAESRVATKLPAQTTNYRGHMMQTDPPRV